WLGPINFFAHDDWSGWGGIELQLLRNGSERQQCLADFINRSFLRKADANRGQVAIRHIHAIALRADFHVGIEDLALTDCAKDLSRFGFDLFFLAANERN